MSERRWFWQLLSTDETEADSIVVCGILLIIGFIAMSGYAVLQDPHDWNALNYGTAGAAILAGIGGSRRLRDGTQNAN